jgi:hypothetical protein
VSSLREEVERERKKGLGGARHFFEEDDGMEQWGGGPCTCHAVGREGGRGPGRQHRPRTNGGGRQHSKAGGRGRRLDSGGGGENRLPTCGPRGHSATRFNRSSDSNRNSNNFK